MTITAGLDVGGAHLKVALVENGRVVAAQQFRCRLWLGLEKLTTALKKAKPLLQRADRFAITMTGELSDLFPSRQTGVETLVNLTSAEFGPERTQYWMGRRGFGDSATAKQQHKDAGSTNFLATASVAGKAFPDALMIDFGSTTADIIPVAGGRPVPQCLTDGERQTSGELVYTGFTRTAVMGVAQSAPFQGNTVTFAREYLATMADVRRILGTLPEGFDLQATADGKGKSLDESLQRFARMLGRDASDGTLTDWQIAADSVRESQLRSLHDGALLGLSRRQLPADAPVIAAGLGSSEVYEVARRLGRRCIAFSEIAGADAGIAEAATICAPAVAVAFLASA